jgi:hypothetical protein
VKLSRILRPTLLHKGGGVSSEETPGVFRNTEAVMATQVRQETQGVAGPAVVMRAVKAPATTPVCGECAYHVPHATRPDGWCACQDAELRWQSVDAGGRVCEDFASWPKGSRVPAFLEAMRF